MARGGNGEAIVWLHIEAERFEPRPVRTQPFDGTRVVVTAGVAEGERIVTRGADLMDNHTEIWLPLGLNPANRQNRGNHYLYLIGRLVVRLFSRD